MDETRTPADAARDAVEQQLWLLRAKLLDCLGPEFGSDAEEVRIGYAYDPATGATVVGLAVDELTYSLSNDELVVQRERGGRVEYARVGSDGEAGTWQMLGPPPSTAAAN